jgi:hypothetical protein
MAFAQRCSVRLSLGVFAMLVLGTIGKIITVEDLETNLPNLLIIPNTQSINSLFKKHRSHMFPTYTCPSIQACFGDEISELKTALLESSGESEDRKVASTAEGVQASTFNLKLKLAVDAIQKNLGILSRKKTARYMVHAADYLLNAFFLVQSRITEFRQSPGNREALLYMMEACFDEAHKIASQPKKFRNDDRFGWLSLIREYRYYTHMNRHWFTLWTKDHPKETLYTVPIPLLGRTFLSIWALGIRAGKTLALTNLARSDFKKNTIDYWEKYPGEAKNCVQKKEALAIQACMAELDNRVGVLTVKKAKYLVEQFSKTPITKLREIAGDLIDWITRGADPRDSDSPFKLVHA